MLAFLLIVFNISALFWAVGWAIDNSSYRSGNIDLFNQQEGLILIAVISYLILSTIALVKKAGAGYFETYFKRKALEEALKIKSLKGDE